MTRTRLKEYAQNIYLYRYSEGPSGRSPSGKLDQTFLVRPHFWNLTLHISRYVHHLATIASHLRPVLATVAFPLRPVGGLDGGNQTILMQAHSYAAWEHLLAVWVTYCWFWDFEDGLWSSVKVYSKICVVWLQSVLQYNGEPWGYALRNQLLTMVYNEVCVAHVTTVCSPVQGRVAGIWTERSIADQVV